MAALNYYLGLKRGAANSPNAVVDGPATAGTAVDVEVRLQINDGANATGLTRLNALDLLKIIEEFIKQGGENHAGANLPAL